jgi:hypothetical protein
MKHMERQAPRRSTVVAGLGLGLIVVLGVPAVWGFATVDSSLADYAFVVFLATSIAVIGVALALKRAGDRAAISRGLLWGLGLAWLVVMLWIAWANFVGLMIGS